MQSSKESDAKQKCKVSYKMRNSLILGNYFADSTKKEQIEAVNLELVSMRPYSNGQSKGQETCEIPADPYEEYFVPVNEHRKYIRYIYTCIYIHLESCSTAFAAALKNLLK